MCRVRKMMPLSGSSGYAKTNSWFVAFRGVAMKGLGRSKFAVFEWTVRVAAKKNAIHICGEGCLSTFISRELNNRTDSVAMDVSKEQA